MLLFYSFFPLFQTFFKNEIQIQTNYLLCFFRCVLFFSFNKGCLKIKSYETMRFQNEIYHTELTKWTK